jgi:hypothetical protein
LLSPSSGKSLPSWPSLILPVCIHHSWVECWPLHIEHQESGMKSAGWEWLRLPLYSGLIHSHLTFRISTQDICTPLNLLTLLDENGWSILSVHVLKKQRGWLSLQQVPNHHLRHLHPHMNFKLFATAGSLPWCSIPIVQCSPHEWWKYAVSISMGFKGRHFALKRKTAGTCALIHMVKPPKNSTNLSIKLPWRTVVTDLLINVGATNKFISSCLGMRY